ncbi:hypothetical protein DH2020_049838 [Rehmannia glutinosa]|uniref:SLH domain-containing protein n=1 Tax=Rehmannia glutinosa TaxID=99300 RepID=A0ABR0U1J6_REHGL
MSSFSLCLPSKIPLILHHRFNFGFSGNPLYGSLRSPSHFSLSASVAERNPNLEVSWNSWDKVAVDDYNGWAITESAPEPVKEKGFRTFAVVGVGASVAAALGLLVYFSFSSKGFGFRLRSPFNALHGFSVPSSTVQDDIESEEVSYDVLIEDAREVPEENLDDVSDAFVAKGDFDMTILKLISVMLCSNKLICALLLLETNSNTMKERKLERIIVPFAVDSAQQEALLALKTLKIIEDDVKADELCTRREYARWLVRANSQLERSRKHRINTFAALSGSRITAFDDVGIEDPDFESIQSLAEAGIVRSKLSDGHSSSNSYVGDKGGFEFSPERFISRQDLVSWKAKIEYKVMPGIAEEMSRKKIGFLDVKGISSDALVELFVDILADEKSIVRGVFGQSKRLQPSKPCTKGQAAVALSSDVRASRESDIKQYWEKKMEQERNRGLEVEMEYRSAITALEQEKAYKEISLTEMMKQKAALDCQEQLLASLKAEVKDMSERLSLERAEYIEEQRGVQDIRNDLQVKLEGLLDRKSILEAEVEALRILRESVKPFELTSQAVDADLGLRMKQEKAKLVQRSSRKLGEGGNGTGNLKLESSDHKDA